MGYLHARPQDRRDRAGSVDSAGAGSDGDPNVPPPVAISSDGRFVVFSSIAGNLVPDDTKRRVDVFVHDRETRRITRVNVDSSGTQSDGDPNTPDRVAISADGRFVGFSSEAANLVPRDTNRIADVFVRDRLLDRTATADVGVSQTVADDAAVPDRRTLALTAVNRGPDAAEEVSLTDRVPRNVRIVATEFSQGDCSRGPVLIVCRLGTLPAGGGATVFLTVQPNGAGAGRLANFASINAAPRDPDFRNNHAVARIELAPRPRGEQRATPDRE